MNRFVVWFFVKLLCVVHLSCVVGYAAGSIRGLHYEPRDGYIEENPELKILQQGTPTSIRGLSVVDDQVAWASGSNGWVARTADRGKTWQWMQVPGFESVDFRDVEAFSAEEAVLLSAGSPLLILRTEDGGLNWTEAHRDDRPEIFFDGMDFGVGDLTDAPGLTDSPGSPGQWGIAFGDAIEGRMPLMVTMDGGRSWQDISAQADLRLMEGEAGFAASGTSIRVVKWDVRAAGQFSTGANHRIFIGTGGSQSRLLFSDDGGLNWDNHPTPMIQGTASTGIFSIAFLDPQNGVIVGGDYLNDHNPERAIFLTQDGGLTWQAPENGTGGYRSAVEYVSHNSLIACGTSGVDISTDGGRNWQNLTTEGYHVVRKAKRGNWLLLAGANGRIAEMNNF